MRSWVVLQLIPGHFSGGLGMRHTQITSSAVTFFKAFPVLISLSSDPRPPAGALSFVTMRRGGFGGGGAPLTDILGIGGGGGATSLELRLAIPVPRSLVAPYDSSIFLTGAVNGGCNISGGGWESISLQFNTTCVAFKAPLE